MVSVDWWLHGTPPAVPIRSAARCPQILGVCLVGSMFFLTFYFEVIHRDQARGDCREEMHPCSAVLGVPGQRSDLTSTSWALLIQEAFQASSQLRGVRLSPSANRSEGTSGGAAGHTGTRQMSERWCWGLALRSSLWTPQPPPTLTP